MKTTLISLWQKFHKTDISDTFLTSSYRILRPSGDIHIPYCRVPTAEQAGVTHLKPEK